MAWRILGGCRDDNCPQLVVDDENGEVYVQGTVVTTSRTGDPGLDAPGPGEGFVRMSRDEFEALLELYRRRR